MENRTNSNQDCGCSDGCCTPKKKNTLLSKIIFFAIILVASSIIIIKLVGRNDNSSVKSSTTQPIQKINNSDSTNKASCGEGCNSTDGSACCPKTKKFKYGLDK